GENPHQQATFYIDPGPPPAVPSVAHADVLQGKELSYNNILDLDAALALAVDLVRPACVIVKHTNPCGVGQDDDLARAFALAKACDPVSAFGGIVAVNREVTQNLAQALAEMFLECVIAPAFATASLEILAKKQNLRVLATKG